jgi:uncharacterized protein (DUF58 family)
MARAWFLGVIIFGLVLAGLIRLRGSLLALTIPLFLYWAYALWRTPESIHLDVKRELSAERAAPHTPVRVQVLIANQGADLDELAIDDLVPPGLQVHDGNPRHLVSLASGRSFAFEYQVQGPRGAFSFAALAASAGDDLGLLRTACEVPAPGQFLVFPLISRIKEVPIRPRRTKVYAGSIPARVGGTGVEFFGVRAYETGDSPARINWHASARHGEDLYSNEFQQERVADVAIVLDGRERSNLFAGGQSLFEQSVLAAGTLADALLSQGNRVGLLVYSQYLQWTMPGYGKVQRERILHALSRAAPGASQIFEGLQYLPARLFPAESQIVLVSPLVEDDYSTLIQLRARGFQVLVITPDPVAFEEMRLPRPRARYSQEDVRLSARIVRLERRWMLDRVRRAGVQIMEWNVSQPFDQAARAALRRVALHRSRP